METWPRITIVTPSYNQTHFLRETIESIIDQNYPNLEYYIVDGGSKDGSQEIIRKYQSYINWWVSEPDGGQTDAINKGFQRATGELLAWVNSDDILLPGCLHAVARTFLQKSQPDIIHANCVYISENGRIMRCVRTPRQTSFWMHRGVWYATAPAVFFQKEILMNQGYLDPRYHLSMDVDIWLKLIFAGARTAHIPSYLGAFRWHHTSKTTVAIQARGDRRRENPETEQLFDTALVDSTQAKRWRWRTIWQFVQIFNLNYLKAWLDVRRWYGQPWQDVYCTRPAGSESPFE